MQFARTPAVLPPLDDVQRAEQRPRRERRAHGGDRVHVIGLRNASQPIGELS